MLWCCGETAPCINIHLCCKKLYQSGALHLLVQAARSVWCTASLGAGSEICLVHCISWRRQRDLSGAIHLLVQAARSVGFTAPLGAGSEISLVHCISLCMHRDNQARYSCNFAQSTHLCTTSHRHAWILHASRIYCKHIMLNSENC